MTQFLKYFFLLFACFLIFNPEEVCAQRQEVLNLPRYDVRPIHFGFLLAYNKSDFNIRYNSGLRQLDTVLNVTSKGEGGFNLGIVTDLRLGEYFNLRFLPTLSFAQRNLFYTFSNTKFDSSYVIKKPVESTFLDFPLVLKYKSARANNMRAYALTGVQYSYDLASARHVKNNVGNNAVFKLKPHSVLGFLGFGFDFYTTYFKFSPEIKYAFSFTDVHIKEDGNIYAMSVSKMYSRIWMLTFYFE